eukprot:s60_g25.t1
MREQTDCVMISIDVKDAFLTVKQETPSIVNCQLVDGQVQARGLGRVLPGQCDGSMLWHRDIAIFIKQQLDMCHSDLDVEDVTGEVSLHWPRPFGLAWESCCILQLTFPIVSMLYVTYSTAPTLKHMVVLKHVVSHLAFHESICISLKWRGRNVGLFHHYPSAAPGETRLEVFTDSDWASDKTSRRSVSCATMFVGGRLLFSSSRAQKLVSLSSAEAEVYSCSSGASDAIMLARLIAWMTGFEVTIHLHTDRPGARGILQSQGVGRVRHLSCPMLWLQDLIGSGQIKLATVSGAVTPADIGTKRRPCNRCKSLLCMIGLFDVARGSLEGTDDPGNVLRKRRNLMTILAS